MSLFDGVKNPQPNRRGSKRRRDREGAGFSAKSHIKQDDARKVVGAQVGAFRKCFPQARMVLIDGNAGDGTGVELDQMDLFDGLRISRPTPQILAELAEEHDAVLVLCERDRTKRAKLHERFPKAQIVASHREAAEYAIANGFNYALWLSDPCGPAGQGIEEMRKVALHILRSDFVIIFNERAPKRFVGVKHAPNWQPHQKYVQMLEPAWWLAQLPKHYLARGPLIKQSPNFHFRLLVVANFLADGVKRLHKVEIIRQEGNR